MSTFETGSFAHWVTWLSEPFSHDPPPHALLVLSIALLVELAIILPFLLT